ncbi:predicted protein [Naegleria gruberi]|uniref:Predicted protein n=1 Tax=Naegleria gruberi TaxID=5762 RepID=D2VVR6_NAEGR|nr:uncharacterized protein NAEGRDRAFT_52649 [Naegleria gruberi]EFC39153.1 predicted protein [Naegleria gruberi]|eukprot:XP_002671897.1 predicted protein [Naegleria gruberi strain NEG-M]
MKRATIINYYWGLIVVLLFMMNLFSSLSSSKPTINLNNLKRVFLNGATTSNNNYRLPIILIPGYAASMLSVEEIANPGKIVRNLYETYPDSTFGMKMMSSSIVGDVEMDSFAAKENGWNIVSPMQRSGLYAVDNLNPDSDNGVGPKRYYFHELIEYLKSIGYEEGVTLFAFPYDWRDSIINSAFKLSTYIANIKTLTKANKVNLISHSMGGYVSKTAYVVNRELYKSVNVHISFATPWQGTGRDWIASSLFGGNLNNIKLDALAVRDVSLGSIAHYERMALSNKAKNVGGSLTPRIVINGVSVTEDQVIQGLKSFLKENTVYYGENNAKSRVIPFRDDIYTSKASNNIIKQIYDSSKLDQPSYFYNIIGMDKPTPISIILKGEGISVDANSNVVISNFSNIFYAMDDYISGDGLATYQSVEADGFEATQRLSFPYSHNGILKNIDSHQAIKYYLGLNCYIIGTWSITLKDSYNKTSVETVFIRESYNWQAYSTRFNMNGTYFGDKWKGSMQIDDKTATFNVVLKEGSSSGDGNCLLSSMTGSILDLSSNTMYTLTGQRSTSGNECNSDKSCPTENGNSVRKCIDGFLLDSCIISQCNAGYKVSVGQPVTPSKCIEENLNWIIAPVVIGSLLLAFLFCLLISLIVCAIIRLAKPKTTNSSHYRQF